MRKPFPLFIMAMTLALAAGCGNPEEERPAEVPDTLATTDTVTPAPDTAATEVVPVELPADFPPDFPIPPASTVTSASTAPDAGGAYSEVSLVSEADSAESYGWYRQALTDAGWQVSSEGQTDDTRTLHATQGDSYVDLTVMPHPGRGAGWAKVDASIWKSGT
jgi:hypothetical protein